MINYVIATWSGPRATLPKDMFYIEKHIKQLSSLKHNLSQITIGYPHNPSENPEYTNYMNKLKTVKNIQIIPFENKGGSYGQYSRIFEKYKQNFQYYIFIEDDYLPVIDNFDSILTEMFEKSKKEKNCGFLCQTAKEWSGHPLHAAISNGISDYESLERDFLKYGMLPHNIPGVENQVIFSRAFIYSGMTLCDMHSRFKSPFYINGYDRIDEHNTDQKIKEYVFVPTQMVNIKTIKLF